MQNRENQTSVSALLRAIPPELLPEWDGNVVRVVRDDEAWAFRPVWVGEGLPADTRRARNAITRRMDARPDEVPVITARRISPGARDILDTEQLSWADASGRAHLVVPGRIYITRLEPIRADAGREFKWSASADAIAETLLTWRTRQLGGGEVPIDRVAAVAEASDVSVAHAARVLRHFDEQLYTVKTGAERGSSATREFRDPGRMLSDWAGHYSTGSGAGRAIEFHVPWREPEQSTTMLVDALAGVDWALTGEAAADRIAPYLTAFSTLDIYVAARDITAARDRVAKQDDVTEVEAGGRIRMYGAEPSVLRLAERVEGVRSVSAVRVYADLLRRGGRSAEAGEHLREVAIGF